MSSSISGLFSFYIQGDDNCNIFIGNYKQLNKDNLGLNNLLRVTRNQTKTISLTSGVTYDIIIVFGENAGGQYVTFRWKYPGNNTNQSRIDRNELLFRFDVTETW